MNVLNRDGPSIYLWKIYIAPLQGKYSEALPTQARAKSKVSAFPRTRVTPLFFAKEGVLFDLLPCPVIVLYCIVFKYLYSTPQQLWQTEALLVRLAPRKETSCKK